MLVLALPGPLFGCDERPSDQPFGATCEADGDCASGLCVAGAAGPAPVCTKSCAPNRADCPDGWHCSAATQSGVVVCSQTPSNPFGQ